MISRADSWCCSVRFKAMVCKSVSLWFQSIYDPLSPWSSRINNNGSMCWYPTDCVPKPIRFSLCSPPNAGPRNSRVNFLSSCLNHVCVVLISSLKIEWCNNEVIFNKMLNRYSVYDNAFIIYELCLQRRRPGFSPWVGKTPWRRKWLATPICLPKDSYRQRSLECYSTWGHKGQTWLKWLTINTSIEVFQLFWVNYLQVFHSFRYHHK